MTYIQRIEKLIDDLADTMRQELATTDRQRFARIKVLCQHAEDLLHETAQTVQDFAANDDGGIGMLGGLPLPNLRRRGEPNPFGPPIRGNIVGADQAELVRNMLASVEALNDDKSDFKQLDLLLRLEEIDRENDHEIGEIYALVRTDVLRRLQARCEPNDDGAARPEGNGSREEAAQGVRANGTPQPMG